MISDIMEDTPEVITVNDRYNNIIKEGAHVLAAVEAQATIAAWGVMKVIHDTCEEAYKILERFGVAGPGQWRAQKDNNLASMSKTYRDLAIAAKRSVSSIHNAHIWYRKTLQIIGDEEMVISLALAPSVTGIIVCSNKITEEDRTKLLYEAIKERLTNPQVRSKLKKLSGEEEENPIFRTNLWRMSIADPKFGAIYPGRLPGQIIYNVLHHYSEIGDLCLFPFVGGGTEADVALYMGRNYYAWDIHHVDDVSERHGERYFTANSLAPWKITQAIEEKADLVFADPPRFMWGNGSWEDSDNIAKYDIGNQDLDEFMESIELIARNAHMALKIGGKFVMLLRQPGFVDIPKEDLTFSIVNRLDRFDLVKRLAVSFPTTSYRPENKGEFASDFMDLIVLEKR